MTASVRGTRPVVTEAIGWLVALALSLVATAAVTTTSAELLFTDGDSVIVPMLARAALGTPGEWAMSPVLFLPETALHAGLMLLGLDLRATLTLNALVNFLLLYGALRFAAGRRDEGRAPVAGAALAFGAFVLMTVFEGTAQRDGASFGTMLGTSTYYSATVLALVVSVGVVRRALDRGGSAPIVPGLVLAAIAAVSVLSNPLFAVWATAPLIGVLGVLALARRVPTKPALLLGGALAAGSVVGYLARAAFADSIVAASGQYFRPDRWSHSVGHYLAVLGEVASTWHGVLRLVVVLALWAAAVVVLRAGWRRRDAGLSMLGAVAVGGPALMLGAVAVGGPALMLLGAIVLGTDAARYLQPALYLPLVAVTALPSLRPVARPRRAALAGIAAASVVAGGIAVPAVASSATTVDADLSCVVDWVEASERTGAGQFWTVRAPKAYLSDPGLLVQVDHTLRPYEWLVDRSDDDGAEVTFLVIDASTYSFVLPAGVEEQDPTAVECGRYTILDFGSEILPLGEPRH